MEDQYIVLSVVDTEDRPNAEILKYCKTLGEAFRVEKAFNQLKALVYDRREEIDSDMEIDFEELGFDKMIQSIEKELDIELQDINFEQIEHTTITSINKIWRIANEA